MSTNSNATAIGKDAGKVNTAAQNTFLGSGAGLVNTSGAHNTMLGFQSGVAVTGGSNTGVGDISLVTLTTGTGNTHVGYNTAVLTNSDTNTVVVGSTAYSADSGTALGYGAAAALNSSIAIGRGATTTVSSQCVIGSTSYPCSNLIIGKGPTDVSGGANASLSSSSGSGTNITGFDLLMKPGGSTGTAKGGNFIVQTTKSGATGTGTNAYRDRYIVVAQGKTLTDATATILFTTSFTASTATCVGGRILVTVRCTDATEAQSFTQIVNWSAVQKSDNTVTATITPDTGADALAVTSGTLTHTWTAVTGTNKVDWKLSADTSLTPSGTNGFVAYYTIENNSENNITLP